MATNTTVSAPAGASFGAEGMPRHHIAIFAGLLVLLLIAPFVLYPIFVMKVLCFALFACAFNLLLGYGGLLSFGHAAFFGMASYVTAHAAKIWGFNPEFAVLAGVLAAAALGRSEEHTSELQSLMRISYAVFFLQKTKH